MTLLLQRRYHLIRIQVVNDRNQQLAQHHLPRRPIIPSSTPNALAPWLSLGSARKVTKATVGGGTTSRGATGNAAAVLALDPAGWGYETRMPVRREPIPIVDASLVAWV
jgi:hypothetical protein